MCGLRLLRLVNLAAGKNGVTWMVFVSSSELIDLLILHLKLPQSSTAVDSTANSSGSRVEVVEWHSPVAMLKRLLQNKSVSFVVSVRQFSSSTSREYCGRPITDNVLFEVGVWAYDSPPYSYRQYLLRTRMRDDLVGQIKQFFKQNPGLGTEKNSKNVDHVVGQGWVLCTVVMVAQMV